jgi:hypothetical protein
MILSEASILLHRPFKVRHLPLAQPSCNHSSALAHTRSHCHPVLSPGRAVGVPARYCDRGQYGRGYCARSVIFEQALGILKSLQPPTCVKWSGTTTWHGLLQGCFAIKPLRKCAPLKHGSLRNKTYQDLMDVVDHTANSSSNSCWRRRRRCCVGGDCVSHVASTRGWSAPLYSKIWAAPPLACSTRTATAPQAIKTHGRCGCSE